MSSARSERSRGGRRCQLGKIRDVPRLAAAIGALYPVSPDLQGPDHWNRVWADERLPRRV